MSNSWFQFKQFIIRQDKTAMKVGTDSVLLGAWTNFGNAEKILDVGSGTGILSFMAAQKSKAKIFAVEIEKNAYEQTKNNIAENKMNDRIFVENISFQSFCSTNKIKFDHIICNPPYFENSLKSNSKIRTIARHNENLSYSDLIKGTAKIISQTGKLNLIIPFDAGNKFIKFAEKFYLYCNKYMEIKPNPKKSAKRIILEFSKQKTECKKKILTIETNIRHCYTDEYINLTKDFYLKF